MDSKPKIYVWCNNCMPNWHVFEALTEDGCFIASHVCSHHCYAQGDMGFTSDWKHKTYNKHYPEGWELELVKDAKAHAGFQAAYARNHAYSQQEYEERMAVHADGGDHASVSVEFAAPHGAGGPGE